MRKGRWVKLPGDCPYCPRCGVDLESDWSQTLLKGVPVVTGPATCSARGCARPVNPQNTTRGYCPPHTRQWYRRRKVGAIRQRAG